ncbi:MAG: heavy metal translocating P-type ATPase metal-binding domain-containing protein [bacterium]|nr:heavy metal translocating P-type ATPase metal-binding domain-containing protein [bacterium]
MTKTATEHQTACFHCGENCPTGAYRSGEKSFCCAGCRTVYELLNNNELNTYYNIEESPGSTQGNNGEAGRFEYLDDPAIAHRILDFKDDNKARITFSIPQMHCASCIWLLENLHRLSQAVLASRVSFLDKKLSVSFDPNRLRISALVELLASIGYEPEISLDFIDKKKSGDSRGNLHRKIGVTGFCFGNIMLFSFPEYFAPEGLLTSGFQQFFFYINALLALPILFYGAIDYFRSAIHGLRQRTINMDVPIALGISMLFIRSYYEILLLNSAGYLDSFAGLVFFLLLGKLFQKKTFDSLAFDRDYRSFFPLSTRTRRQGRERFIPVTELVVSDRILIRNRELIPADTVLIEGDARIDYAFVTGESDSVKKEVGDIIYAGGRQVGGTLELEVVKEVSQSYLTRLWNEAKPESQPGVDGSSVSSVNLANRISKHFTFAVLGIAAATLVFWWIVDSSIAVKAATAVLIVACPCALALSTPFTLGTVVRILGKSGLYLKNSRTVEELASVDNLVVDKTGTLTTVKQAEVEFAGKGLTTEEQSMVRSLVRQSSHPMSRKIHDRLDVPDNLVLSGFEEKTGSGISCQFGDKTVRIGSRKWTSHGEHSESSPAGTSRVYLSIDSKPHGWFLISAPLRPGMKAVMDSLRQDYSISLLSGDNNAEEKNFRQILGENAALHFEQSPHQKKEFVEHLRQQRAQVLMLGDGLNDGGALAAANVGMAVTEDISSFSPACDAILDAASFDRLHKMIILTRKSINVIKTSFGISFAYNIVGLSFAVSGLLSPLVSAILMPISSVSVVLFTTLSTNWLARKEGL